MDNYIRNTCRQEWIVAQLESAIRAVRNGCSKTEVHFTGSLRRMCREEKHAGTDWFYCFRKRFPNLVLRVAEPTSKARAKGFDRKSVGDIFVEHFYPPDKFYDMEEFGVSTASLLMFSLFTFRFRTKSSLNADRTKSEEWFSAEKGVTTTVVFTMSAAGDFLPPLFIFPRQRMNDALKTNLQLLEKARRNHVRTVSIPTHTSHKLQPCDLTPMASVRSHYNSTSHSLGQACSLSASRSTAENGFRRAALVTLKPAIFTDEDFASADYLSQMNVDQAQIGNDDSEVDNEEELGVQLEPEEVVDVEQVHNGQRARTRSFARATRMAPLNIWDKMLQRLAVGLLNLALKLTRELHCKVRSRSKPRNTSQARVRWDAHVKEPGNTSIGEFSIPPCDVAAPQLAKKPQPTHLVTLEPVTGKHEGTLPEYGRAPVMSTLSY
ncbi:conserved hypothetical protein [Culex quinquefasciatus]|uniref:HTH CENPB-type domain-containing protein n=1 Tax=Culex quinquefasciatus TaxID=7176 RepID=B0WYM5_CULQU|nr:conserved hypothetical protein [Culex quinquefasciatus]|eukprot:XP_001862497.1 conserved hypothetical protein [Culex quinquefasciatus]